MSYRAPVRDLALSLQIAGHPALVSGAFAELDDDTVAAVLEAAGAFTEEQLAPLNRKGDQVGARYENGAVIAAPGFADAYQAFVAGGWNSLSADPEHGGQGLTKAMELAVFEMVHASNMAFGLCPMLTQGAIEALDLHGTERQKSLVLPKLVSGEWTGTMNLTEPQAGSDLAAVTTRAEPDGNGGYRLYGQKIFITWGDHDAADNICHLVLARLPDSPPGVKGISLFLATKREVLDDGSLGIANDLRAGSIEHKLGIHGSPTCVMLFEGAKAELVGEINNGIAHMFVMMNAARLQVGVQGVGIAERAFQQALAFAQERKQGRAVWSAEYPAPLYGHPDVRRSLLLMKAKIEAARGICMTTGVLADQARLAPSEAERATAKARQELLTPIAKAWSTDVGVEVASMGVQVHGGMGFIEETGAAQHYRDARIAPIYEGTNGIQAIDLIGRKVAMQDGAVMDALCAEMHETVQALQGDPALGGVAAYLEAGVAALERATDWVLQNKGPNALAGATPYLKLAGDVVGGWMLARQAQAVAGGDDGWSKSKAALARVFASQVLAQAPGLAAGVMEGADDLEAVGAEALGA
ncbi:MULTISPECIES: acyl-CoA dehydrogenase [unclassified Phenylobacterium]|uniref:acyl-CoA dehydrogenase n=1 Tax=unclassified Phenylobacterium TaxID=2640670 RepID=UPI0022B47189|nr:acyl-CoA dehydrogenase [Phenylobacterium sp. NIBR 498073]MBS0489159.1 acyl-CoA dehydrogenase [Pseudomonadota bacterium]WGU41089.1 acyl-CoA dehydrogenase [Phenylobacterium sp. NIBR 498073]